MIGTVLLVIAGIFCFIIIVGIFIPSKYRFSKSIIIHADKKLIFNTIDDLASWKKWSAWSTENDPKITITYGEITSGVGAVMEWREKKWVREKCK